MKGSEDKNSEAVKIPVVETQKIEAQQPEVVQNQSPSYFSYINHGLNATWNVTKNVSYSIGKFSYDIAIFTYDWTVTPAVNLVKTTPEQKTKKIEDEISKLNKEVLDLQYKVNHAYLTSFMFGSCTAGLGFSVLNLRMRSTILAGSASSLAYAYYFSKDYKQTIAEKKRLIDSHAEKLNSLDTKN